MAFKILKSGKAQIQTERDAVEALERLDTLKNEIQALMQEHGITDKLAEVDAIKAAATEFMVENEIDQLDMPGAGMHATLVQQHYDARFVGTDEELDMLDLPDGKNVIPLKTIIGKKFGKFHKGAPATRIWNRVTRRVVVAELVEEVISEGLLSVDDVSPSFVEKTKKPYIRVFKD